jgi:hypothetical protein
LDVGGARLLAGSSRFRVGQKTINRQSIFALEATVLPEQTQEE